MEVLSLVIFAAGVVVGWWAKGWALKYQQADNV